MLKPLEHLYLGLAKPSNSEGSSGGSDSGALAALSSEVNNIKKDYISKANKDTQILSGALQVMDQLDITDLEGHSVQIGFTAGTTYLATNNGFDFLADVIFNQAPTTSSTETYEEASLDSLVRKQQVAQAISNVTGNHLDRWCIMGVPESITLTTELQPVYMPATTRFPSLPPASMQPNEDGTGIKFLEAGLIHIKRNVSLGGTNTKNLYYEARINGQTLEPLQAQAVSVSENTMNYSIEFYWQVSAGQELTIWANCLSDTCALNYKGVTTVVEYM